MTVTAEVVRSTFAVREPCTLEVIARPSRALSPGDTVEVQFPNSWSLVSGPSFTREFQTADPQGEHYVAVSAPASAARFGVKIAPRHLFTPDRPTVVRGRRGLSWPAGALTQGPPPASSVCLWEGPRPRSTGVACWLS
jgi:hypothetical protein